MAAASESAHRTRSTAGDRQEVRSDLLTVATTAKEASITRRGAAQLLTIESVYRRLACSRAFAYSLVASGALASVRIAPHVLRVTEDDLLAFVSSRREPTQSTDH